jgi:hypothetical protein
MNFPADKVSSSFIFVITMNDKAYCRDSVCHFKSVSGFISSSGFKKIFNATSVFASYETARGILPRKVSKFTSVSQDTDKTLFQRILGFCDNK